MDIYPSVMYTGPTIDQQIYQANYDAIRRLAERENCVIVGRCADAPLPLQPVKEGSEDKERAGNRRSGTGTTDLDRQKASVISFATGVVPERPSL